MEAIALEKLLEGRGHLQQEVVQSVVVARALFDDVHPPRVEDFDFCDRVVARADSSDQPRGAEGHVGDDEGVLGVRLAFLVGLGDVLEVLRGDMGDVDPHILGDGHHEPSDVAELVDGYEHLAMPARLFQQLADTRLILIEGPGQQPFARRPVERHRMVLGLSYVYTDVHVVIHLRPLHSSPSSMNGSWPCRGAPVLEQYSTEPVGINLIGDGRAPLDPVA